MSLTYIDNGTPPIAKIVGDDVKYVYISEEEAKSSDILDEPLDGETIQIVCDALADGLSLNEVIKMISTSPVEGVRNIDAKPGEMVFIMPSPESERMMIGGSTGVGKSTIASLYASLWREIYPEGKIFLFARQEDDPAFENIPHEEIVVDDRILDINLDLDDFAGSLVIFDDMDNLQDKRVSKCIHDLMADLMSNGRKKDIWVVYLTHILLNRNQTKVSLNESNKVVFFPGPAARQNINFLKTYAGLSNENIKRLTELKSRWVMLSRLNPIYVIHEKGIFLL